MTKKERQRIVKQLEQKYVALAPFLDAQSLRVWAATEAEAIGWGGKACVAEATMLTYETIVSGAEECRRAKKYRWRKGPGEGRIRRKGGGRRPLGMAQLSEQQRKEAQADDVPWVSRRLLELLHEKPVKFNINRTNWTHKSLAQAFEKTQNFPISSTTVGKYLKAIGIRWKKARQVLTSPDPDYRKKVNLVLQTLHGLESSEEFFFLDEVGPLMVKKRSGKTYSPKGKTPVIPYQQRSKGSVVTVAALSATTNQLTWRYTNSRNTVAMFELIELLFNQYYNMTKIYITWDAASWHDSNALGEWLDIFNFETRKEGSGPIIELVPLPSCSQFLNVIEGVFSAMKRAIIDLSDYQSEEEMKTAISLHFDERNRFFRKNPRRAGKKIWEIDFFRDYGNLESGNYCDY